jgi:hypothetical protein
VDCTDCTDCIAHVMSCHLLYFYFSFYCQPTGALTYDFPAQLRVANRKFAEGDFISRHCLVTELNTRTEVHTLFVRLLVGFIGLPVSLRKPRQTVSGAIL